MDTFFSCAGIYGPEGVDAPRVPGKKQREKGARSGDAAQTAAPPPSAPPEIEPEEAAVVEAAGDNEQPRPAGGVVEPD